MAFSPGYVHPDEHFQNGEVAAGAVLGLQAQPPWEFTSAAPARSIAPPLLVSGAPYALLRVVSAVVGPHYVVTGALLLFLPRLLLVASSFLVDAALYRLCDSRGLPADAAVVTHAALWPTLVFYARPFSNTLETFLVVAALSCMFLISERSTLGPSLAARGLWCSRGGVRRMASTVTPAGAATSASANAGASASDTSSGAMAPASWLANAPTRVVALGAVGAAGLFCRFTMAFFCLPLAAYAVVDTERHFRERQHKRSESLGSGGAGGGVGATVERAVSTVAAAGVGAAAVSAVLIVVDSLYFGGADANPAVAASVDATATEPEAATSSLLTVTPWNSLRYNMQADNLALHGIHPRYQHALVNVPLLFGPLGLLAAWRLLAWVLARCGKRGGSTSAGGGNGGGGGAYSPSRSRSKGGPDALQVVAAACALSGLGLLSVAPHQEARFLVPLGPLLCVALAPSLRALAGNARVMRGTLAFNAALVVFFGVLHQGGLTRCIRYLGSELTSPQSPLSIVADDMADDADAARVARCPARHVDIVFHETYMPPQYLLAHPAGDDTVTVLDVGEEAAMLLTLDARAPFATPADAGPCGAPSSLVLVAPRAGGALADLAHTSVDGGAGLAAPLHTRCTHFDVTPLNSFGGHISTEHMPSFAQGLGGAWSDATLDAVLVHCARAPAAA